MSAPALLLALALQAAAQAAQPASDAKPAAAAVAPAPAGYDQDLDEVPAEPDFTVVDLPTNLRLPRHKLAFRLTHRFGRPLGEGDFSDLLADLFGFDGGAQVGLGLRFGLFRGTQLGVYRTSERTIQLHLQQELLSEGQVPGRPVAARLDRGPRQLRPQRAGHSRAAHVLAGGRACSSRAGSAPAARCTSRPRTWPTRA